MCTGAVDTAIRLVWSGYTAIRLVCTAGVQAAIRLVCSGGVYR